MSIEYLISELWAYAHTEEYREGLFVEASGLVLGILLLIVGVKVIAYYLTRQSRSTTNFASSFFITQLLREVLLLQLKSGGVNDASSSLRAALEAKKIRSLFSHIYYGNTENLLELLRVRMREGYHIDGHRNLTLEQRVDIAKESQSLLARLDNLLVMLASLRQEEQCVCAYEFRLVLTTVSDYLNYLSMSSEAPPPRTYASMSAALAASVDSWFNSCKMVLDRQLKNRVRWSYARLFVSLPWVVAHRFFMRRWKRLRGHSYIDPFGSNFPALFCKTLNQMLGAKWDEAITASGINENDILLMMTQHVALSQDKCIELLEAIRPFIPVYIWNGLLAETLIADVDSGSTSVVTVDAAKANAIYYLSRLAIDDDSTNYIIAQAFQSLFSLRPASL